MRSRGLPSPDRADAVLGAMAGHKFSGPMIYATGGGITPLVTPRVFVPRMIPQQNLTRGLCNDETVEKIMRERGLW